MRRLLGFASALLVALGTAAVPAQAEKRVALVLGNDQYPNLPADQQLRKAVNDARAIGLTLGRLGFEVISGENLGRQAIVDKLDELTARLAPGDTAFFFFAGHGVTIAGGNYLLPSDVPNIGSGQETRLARAALGESDIVADLQGRGVRVAVVVLDACRNNPFRRPGVRSVGAERGLSRIDPVRGVFTLYSAGIGQTALDRLGDNDPDPNSVFTRVLVPALAKPGLHLGDLAFEVREEVARLARTIGHDQRPASYDETLGGRIYLAGQVNPSVSGPPPAGPRIQPLAADEVFWLTIKDSRISVLFEEFLKGFPASPHAAEAAAKLKELKGNQVAVVVPPAPSPVPPRPDVQPAVGVPPEKRDVQALTSAQERALKPTDKFKECDSCPDMVVVPAGLLLMGSPPEERERAGNEGPQHLVSFAQPFAVGRLAVTFEQWDACVNEGGCNGYKPADNNWGRGGRPVINVSWQDAKAYTAWLARKTGKNYRLLSEAEREYVARAGTRTRYWWGNDIGPHQANYLVSGGTNAPRGESADKSATALPAGASRPAAADSFPANPWGLRNVHGNVSEWVEDCWNGNYIGAPADGSAWVTGPCVNRVLRGGNFSFGPERARAAYRGFSAQTSRFNMFGFRVARSLAP